MANRASTFERRLAEQVTAGQPGLALDDLQLTTFPASLRELLRARVSRDAARSLVVIRDVCEQGSSPIDGRTGSLINLGATIGEIRESLALPYGPDDEDLAEWSSALLEISEELGGFFPPPLSEKVNDLLANAITLHMAEDDEQRNAALDLLGQIATEIEDLLSHSTLSGSELTFQDIDLSLNFLKDIPHELFRDPYLRNLSLASNEILALPFELNSLESEIQSLNVSENRLTELPPWIGLMPNLRVLDASANYLTSIDFRFTSLSLTDVDLSANEIVSVQSEAFPASIRSIDLRENKISQWPINRTLSNLYSLNLSSNSLEHLPAALADLYPGLTALSVAGNNIRELPPNLTKLDFQLLDLSGNLLEDLPNELADLSPTCEVFVDDNPLPDTLLRAADLGARALTEYLRSLQGKTESCRDAKLILLGEGNVGKSSLVARLREEAFVENRDTTHGIELSTVELGPTGGEYVLHTWDFGGQEIYRVTHQFYFSQDAIFLVVWRPREGLEQGGVEFWLERIHRRVGSRGRVILVSTYADEGRLAHIDLRGLKIKYGPLLAGHVAVDNESLAGFEQLRETILTALPELAHIGDPIAERWRAAQQWIGSERNPVLSRLQYDDVCRDLGLTGDAASTWLSMLHAFGEVLYFADDPSLVDVIVRDPELLATAVSYLLEDVDIEAHGGVASHAEIVAIWRQKMPNVSVALFPFLIRLMERHEISVRIADDQSLLVPVVPYFLQEDLPWKERDASSSVRARFELGADPVGLIAWLTCRFFRHSVGVHWRSGVFLRDGSTGSEALIEQEGDSLYLEVRGGYPAEMFTWIRRDIDYLLSSRWPYISYDCFIPCLKRTCVGRFRFEAVARAAADARRSIQCPDCFDDLEVSRLLLGFDTSGRDEVGNALVDLTRAITEIGDVGIRSGEEISELRAEIQGDRAQAGRLREVVGELRWQVGMIAADCPRLFTLAPVDRAKWHPSRLVNSEYELTLWCEHPGHEHPTGKPYRIRKSQEWFVQARGVLVVMSRVLRLLPVVSGGVDLVVGSGTQREIDEALALMDEIGLAAFDLAGESPTSRDVRDLGVPRSLSVNGYEARVLKEVLGEVDPHSQFAEMSKEAGPAGSVLWVCPSHRAAYDPGLPVLSFGS